MNSNHTLIVVVIGCLAGAAIYFYVQSMKAEMDEMKQMMKKVHEQTFVEMKNNEGKIMNQLYLMLNQFGQQLTQQQSIKEDNATKPLIVEDKKETKEPIKKEVKKKKGDFMYENTKSSLNTSKKRTSDIPEKKNSDGTDIDTKDTIQDYKPDGKKTHTNDEIRKKLTTMTKKIKKKKITESDSSDEESSDSESEKNIKKKKKDTGLFVDTEQAKDIDITPKKKAPARRGRPRKN